MFIAGISSWLMCFCFDSTEIDLIHKQNSIFFEDMLAYVISS